MKETRRTRNWMCITYPESMPDDWLEILKNEHVKMFISPLHNLDTNENGEIKKEHYHNIIMFENVKTKEQAQEIFDKVNGVDCKAINDLKAYSRYLCHLDEIDEHKHIYATSDVIELSGADYMEIINIPSNKYKDIRDMIEFIKFNDIVSYSDLFEWCSENNETWFRLLCDNSTYVIKEYLSSRKWTKEANVEKKEYKKVKAVEDESEE